MNLRNKEQAAIQKLTDIARCCQEIAEDAVLFVEKLMDTHSKTKDLYGILQKIHQKAMFCSSTSIILQAKYIHAKLADMCADLDISEKLWKEFLRICNENLVFQFKIFGYKNLATISLKRGRSQKSFVYLQKLLKYAWLYNKKELETQVYEKISRVFYYRNEMEQALFFHERALNYETEPLDSNIRRIGVHVARFDQDQKRNKGRDATLSEDEFDLAIFHTNSDTPKEKEEKNISDETQQSMENHLQQSLKKHRLDHYQLDPSVTSLDGMKALALVKNRMSEPLGPVCRVSKYRNNSYVNLQGSVGFATQKSTLVPKFFISQKKNTVKVIDKVHLSHLSGNRNIDSLLNLGNFYDQENHELLSNDCIRRREVIPAMNRLIQVFMSNLRVFHEETLSKLKSLQHI